MSGFPGLVGGELLKIRRQPVNRTLPLITLAAVMLVAALSSGGGRQAGDPGGIARAVLDPLTLTLQVGVGIPLLVLSVRVVGQEYQLGTVRVLVARGTGRMRLLLAKLLALGITAAATAVVTGTVTAGALWLVEPEAVQAAYDMGAKWITLEVRTSNDGAMRMYEGFGFKVIGRRKGYYTDNGEDAIVMWSDSIYSPRFRRAYEANLERIDVTVRGLRREAGPTRDG